jgi:release factor glutamine methyltransferase
LPISPLDTRLLVQHVLNISAEEYIKRTPITLSESKQQQLDALIKRREKGEPIAKIIGKKAFWKDEFITNTHTLDPRPDSEWLIEALLDEFPDRASPYHFLDCGTGSGCLILSALREFPQARGIGIDASTEALKVANTNAIKLNMAHRIEFIQQNWYFDWTVPNKILYDAIISNPPYIPTDDITGLMDDVKIYDPMQSLDGGNTGLSAYKQLFTICFPLVKHKGRFVCEIGCGQQDDVINLAREAGFQFKKHVCDLAGIIRILVFVREA